MRGDRCWRDLTCLYYHHETQPMPNPLSWYFHRLPKRLHRIEVLGNHFAQLIVPWFLFFPQPIATLAGIVIVGTQLWLVLSGNFAWLNFVTIALAISAFDNSALGRIVPLTPYGPQTTPEWFVPLLAKFLDGDRPTLRLLRTDPFGGQRPRFVRALLYLYRFTTAKEHRETGAWWHRELVGDYVPPVSLRGTRI